MNTTELKVESVRETSVRETRDSWLPSSNYLPSELTSLTSPQTIDIGFKNVSYSVTLSLLSQEKKEILKDVSGLFKSGELTAIMGPSGSGKSSLLNVLSGFIKKGVSGTVYTNGLPVDTHRVQTKSHSAYITQEDHLNPLFTPREIMLHAANVKLGSKHNRKSKLQLIEDLLVSMSISEAGNTLCGRMSGGERKRLNICLELIDDPPVLFLDEPTSGLDSTNCRLLVSELKELAASRRTVICTIHQPSAVILSMFHHLYFLSSGRTMFQGDVTNLLPFLNYVGLPCPIFHNPADFIMDVVSGEFGCYTEKLITANTSKNWRKDDFNLHSTEGIKQDITEMSSRKHRKPSEWMRYKYLVLQICKQLHRDRILTYVKCALHTVVACLIGAIFFRLGDDATKVFNNTIYLFITSLYISYTTLMPATLKFPSQLLVLKKEHFNNWYKFTTFFLAFLTVNIPLQLFLTSVFFVLTYLLTGQLIEVSRFTIFTATIFFETIISDVFGIILGSTQNPVNGIFAGSALLIIATVFAGYLIPLKDLTGFARIISSLNFFRYAFELKMTATYGFERKKLMCPEEAIYCHVKNPKIMFETYGLEEDQITRDLMVLSVYTLASILLAFIRLKYCFKKIH